YISCGLISSHPAEILELCVNPSPGNPVAVPDLSASNCECTIVVSDTKIVLLHKTLTITLLPLFVCFFFPYCFNLKQESQEAHTHILTLYELHLRVTLCFSYCECFATGVMCSNCDCSNCHNNVEHEVKRHKAIQSCLGRNPDAFRPKIAGGKSGDVKGWHNRGCNCKRSNCLKNYCECYEANIMCTSSCKCVGCRNYDCGSESSLREKTSMSNTPQDWLLCVPVHRWPVSVISPVVSLCLSVCRWPVSVICPAVVGAVCGCLLAQAEEAERGNLSPIQAELMVLEEFGHCVSQISEAMFKSSPHGLGIE
uniref:CRC domain-containing protein n=1 Tax=Echeneis naucrates TaxID=173247 RepID=A0A665UZY3_ECHNA